MYDTIDRITDAYPDPSATPDRAWQSFLADFMAQPSSDDSRTSPVAGPGPILAAAAIVPPTGGAGSGAPIPDPNGTVPGGPWTTAPGQQPGTFYGPSPEKGQKPTARWVPAEGDGGPPGSEGYWKTKEMGQKGWSRFDQSGNPITPEQAHPGSKPPAPKPAAVTPEEVAGGAAGDAGAGGSLLSRLARPTAAGGAIGAVIGGGVTAWNDADAVRDHQMTVGDATADVAVQAGVGLAAGATGAAAGAAGVSCRWPGRRSARWWASVSAWGRLGWRTIPGWWTARKRRPDNS